MALSAVDDPPPAQREFRGVWVATVDRIDWPPKDSTAEVQQKTALIAIMDRAAALHMNAVIFQVRPMGDALYDSPYEPWSEFLTGVQGRAPSPMWDPLSFAVEEAHKRGMELHAWFNPYRVWHPAAKGQPAANSLPRTHPNWVRSYGKLEWLDPGDPNARSWSEKVVEDVVRRYDVDGVHIDDYFYPYPIRDANKQDIPFPDDSTYARYRGAGGSLDKLAWRRENINKLVSELYRGVKKIKPWVKFGISPFGIYRPGIPSSIVAGIDQYNALASDPVKWLQEGWCDYLTPQLYWKIEKPAQSYPVLAKWWASQNVKGRHLWIGNNASEVSSAWPVQELIDQIAVTRKTAGAEGNIFFSMAPFMRNSKNLDDVLLGGPYRELALVPRSPWLKSSSPGKPRTKRVRGEVVVAKGSSDTFRFSIYTKSGNAWQLAQILPASTELRIVPSSFQGVSEIAIAGLDRDWNESVKAVVKF